MLLPRVKKNKQEELGGAKTHTVKSGVAHRASENDIEALRDMRALFDFLPLSNEQDPPVRESQDTRDRSVDALDIVIPADSGTPYDMKEIIHTVRTALHYCIIVLYCTALSPARGESVDSFIGRAGRTGICGRRTSTGMCVRVYVLRC